MRCPILSSRFICCAYGKRGADVRPDFNWRRQPGGMMGAGRFRVQVQQRNRQKTGRELVLKCNELLQRLFSDALLQELPQADCSHGPFQNQLGQVSKTLHAGRKIKVSSLAFFEHHLDRR